MMTRLDRILKQAEKRLEKDIKAQFKAIGITNAYTFPDGVVMGLPEFLLASDRFIYELKGGDEWYKDIVCKHTGLRVFKVRRSEERRVFFIS